MPQRSQNVVEKFKLAEYLLKIKAVQFRPEEPFVWSSGWSSPIYCDNRLTLSYPEIRRFIRDAFVSAIRRLYPTADAIAGVATGAIAQGALIAEAMDLPMVYVRPKPKGHGLLNLIEGSLDEGYKYVVIEDLVSTGKSSVNAVKALQDKGKEVLGTLSIFSYGFPQATETFNMTGTRYHSLTDLESLLEVAKRENYIDNQGIEAILHWQKDPENWHYAL